MISRLLSDKRGLGRVGTIILIVAALLAAGGIGSFLGFHISKSTMNWDVRQIFDKPFDGKPIVTVLILGEDNTGLKSGRGLSDTIILASVDFDKKHVAALSIPRDTRVDVNGYGRYAKINSAFVQGGPSGTARIVSQLTGIRPDYYIVTNVEGFKDTVDAVGGVEIDVEKNMRYTDRRGGLYINLKKGVQVLDGDKAMQYVRFRHDAMGDITRIERQQKFLKALAKKALEPGNLPKLPGTVGAVLENVQTDMSPKDMLHLGKFVSEIDMSKVEMATLPGTPDTIGGVSYWIADMAESAKVVQELFFPPDASLPTVEVLNGSGIAGAAAQVAEVLRQKGYEIKSVGNAERFDYESCEVINHNGTEEGAQQIAALFRSQVVKQEPSEAATADVTLIVGKDVAALSGGS